VSDVETARKRWMAERPKYDGFGHIIADALKIAVQAEGIWCEVTSRTKEPHSLVKKLLKGRHTYESLPDKLGVRCVVRYFSEVERVITISKGVFTCSDPDRKLIELAEDRVGYSSTHIDVRLRPGDSAEVFYPPAQYGAELQIRTLGQHLWAEMSHDAVYKNDETLAVLPSGLKRRVNLMAGLIEVADGEFDRINEVLELSPQARIYKALELHYYKLASRRPDPELSLKVIGLLIPLYGVDVPDISRRIDSFFLAHELTLRHVYAQAEEWKASAFFYQPEALMIYELLEADQVQVRKVWNSEFPEAELESIANAFGISFD